MSEQSWGCRPKDPFPTADIEGYDLLAQIALDMRSSWNHATDQLWQQLDPLLWELTHNPWVVLQTVSREKLKDTLADPAFRKTIDDLIQTHDKAAAAPTWFQQFAPSSALQSVAYFSMEFMLSEGLPIYSGGLGNVAGDQLKAASDLGVPVIGVGLLYQQGYFRQVINAGGAQEAVFPYNDPGQLPITPLRLPNGEWLRLQLDLPGYPIWFRAWQARVGRVTLYLLDSNDAANFPPYRSITSELYCGDPYTRLMQEMILGIGGWQMLVALGIEPEVCHLNEGHAALAVLERARSFMQTSGLSFEAALAATRAGNLFTTHTAVTDGFDRFPPALIERCLGDYARTQLGVTLHDFLALGRQDPTDPNENFNMAYLAIRGSGAVNGVSRLHGGISRRLFAPLFPRWPVCEVPIGHVTNGVHVPTWDSEAADQLWTEASNKDRWLGTTETLGDAIRRVPDAALWQFRATGRAALVEYARARLSLQLASSGASPGEVEGARHLFDPRVLTLGFARRFATYKRPNLLLHDPERLRRLLTNPEFPVQLILAGKAHPEDRNGQALILQWTQFIRRPDVRPHAIFLADYDMLLTEQLVRGVDVWLNTPRRPWEASGTSGMKILVNGGLNISELDGWWAEAYAPEVGWAIGDGQEHGDDPAWDAFEAGQLYDLLEHEVIPAFYTRDQHGIANAWVMRMRESMARLTPRFSSNRTVRDYTTQYYLPAAARYRQRTAASGQTGAAIAELRHELDREWNALRFGPVKIESGDGSHRFEIKAGLGAIDPATVRIELYADGFGGNPPERHEMTGVRQPDGDYLYAAAMAATRPGTDFTVRAIPKDDKIAIPLEDARIIWQR